jgi:hypothetical protein
LPDIAHLLLELLAADDFPAKSLLQFLSVSQYLRVVGDEHSVVADGVHVVHETVAILVSVNSPELFPLFVRQQLRFFNCPSPDFFQFTLRFRFKALFRLPVSVKGEFALTRTGG